jgi:hypothetical protein
MGRVFVDVKTDGTVIETGRKLYRTSSERMGVGDTDRDVVTALRFEKAAVFERGTRTEAPKYWTGVIEAAFYGDPVYKIPDTVAAAAATLSSNPRRSTQNMHAASKALDFFGSAERSPPMYQPKMNYIFDISGDDVGYCEDLMDRNLNKGVKTVRGKTMLSHFHKRVQSEEHGSSQTKRFKTATESSQKHHKSKTPQNRAEESPRYPLLGKISLNYCSAVGLIHAGILPKPPGFDYQKLAYKKPRQDNWRELSEAKVQVFRTEPVIVGGSEVVASKEFDLFDLLAEDEP